MSTHLIDERWHEVFLLIAGLVPRRIDANELLLLMEKQAQTYINTHELQGLLQWAEEATEGFEGSHNAAAERVKAFYQNWVLVFDAACDLKPIRVCALDFACACILDYPCILDYARELNFVLTLNLNRARSLKEIKILNSANLANLIAKLEALKSNVPGDDQPYEIRQAFAENMSQLWFEALHLAPRMTKLSENEIKALNNCFYINELMVRCKEAAVGVSSEVWAGIEERMWTGRMRDEG